MRTILRALVGSLAVLLAAGGLALGGASPAAALDASGVSGRVIDADTGAGIAGATVAAYCLDGDYWNPCYDDQWDHISATTADDGSYALPLAAGTYRLRVEPADDRYPDLAYGSADSSLEAGADIVVGDGPVTADFELIANSVITGRVTGAGVGPLAGIRLEARTYTEEAGWRDNVIEDAKTRADGTYELRVPADTYRIVFNTFDRSGGEGNPGLRNETVRWEEETYVEQVVERGANITGIDRELAEVPHGTVTGHVESTTGEPAAGITVTGFLANDGDWWDRSDLRVITDANGDYTMYVVPGDYRFGFTHVDWDNRSEPAQFAPAFYAGATTLAEGTTVSVGTGEASGIDAVMTAYGHITGRATAADGTPIENAYVTAWTFDENTQEWSSVGRHAETGADGTYVLTVGAGTYKVGFEAYHQGYLTEYHDDAATREQATDVVVGSGTVSGIDAELTMGAEISGTVTSEDGQPLEDIDVRLYNVPESYDGLDYTSTDSDGRYTFRGLTPGAVHQLGFSGTGWIREFYADAATLEEATDVIVGESGPVDAVMASSQGEGSITGTVTDDNGQPVPGVSVSVYNADTWDWIGSTDTPADGTYSFPGLMAGQYEVSFYLEDDYLYAENTSRYVDVSGPTVADLRVFTGGRITGTVTGTDGEPVGDGYVEVYATDTQDFVRSGYISYDGSYQVSGVPAGSYRLQFTSSEGHRSEWFSDKSSFADADDVVVHVREDTTADVELSAGATVEGRVTYADGSPVEWGEVQVQRFVEYEFGDGWETVTYAFTDEDGRYRSRALEPGTYRVAIDLWDDVHLPAYSEVFTIGADDAGVVTHDLVVEKKQPPAITSLAAPVVSGEVLVGKRLTATAGEWDVADVAVHYQWLRDGVPVDGAIEAAYAVTEPDAGHRLSVQVTAEKEGYVSATADSEATEVVSHGPLVNAQPPIVTGTPQVGETLSVYPGVWSAEGATFTYQWLRDGRPVDGATGATYALGADDLGAVLSVEVSATKATWEPGSAVSEPSGAVVEGVFPAVDAPVISGDVWITETIEAEFTAPVGADVAYSWQVRPKETGKGTPVYQEVGTERSLELVGEWKNGSLRLVVTLTKPGYTTATYVVLVEDPLR